MRLMKSRLTGEPVKMTKVETDTCLNLCYFVKYIYLSK